MICKQIAFGLQRIATPSWDRIFKDCLKREICCINPRGRFGEEHCNYRKFHSPQHAEHKFVKIQTF